MKPTRCRELIARSPDDFHILYEGLWAKGFVYRGQRNAHWELSTRLERQYSQQMLYREEHRMLSDFKKRAHNYVSNLPKTDDDVEWLAYLQHHGAPTRLLDFTWSPYVAAYFALCHERPDNGDVVIWAINNRALNMAEWDFARKHIDRRKSPDELMSLALLLPEETSNPFANQLELHNSTHDIFLEQTLQAFGRAVVISKINQPGVFRIQSAQMNRRIEAQCGLFLAPVSLDLSFKTSLSEMLGIGFSFEEDPKLLCDQRIGELYEHDAVLKIRIPKRSVNHFQVALYQMNLRPNILFPDLEGLVRSLTPMTWDFGFLPFASKQQVTEKDS